MKNDSLLVLLFVLLVAPAASQAHSIRIGAKGLDDLLEVTVEKIEINAPIDDALFEMPEAGPVE